MAAASPAFAADYYVDRDSLMEDPDCITSSQPCDTIAEAMSQAAFTPQTDVVHVGPSANDYPGIVFQNARIDLIGNDYAGVGGGTVAVLDGGMEPGVDFDGGAFTREIRGFTIRGGDNPDLSDDFSLEGILATQLTIAENVFDDDAAQIDAYVQADGSPVISDNRITGASDLGADATRGIEIDLAVAPMITRNSVTGVERSIDVQAVPPGIDTVVVEDNVLGVLGDNFTPPAGIHLANASGDLRRNLISADTGASGFTTGIASQGDSPGTINLSRNRILGLPYNAASFGPGDPVSVSGDVIADNGAGGLIVNSAATVTNATIWGNGGTFGDINLNSASGSVVLDSTIIGDNGVDFLNPASTCTASFSRGPTTGTLCSFQTNANPSFVNAAANDLHLTPADNAALIDQGNPASPAESLDLDGDPRVLDGFRDTTCISRRDIGADELAVEPSDCDPPQSTLVARPRKRSLKRRARFAFASDEPGSIFQCKLDRKPFVSCSSPFRTRRLKPRRHIFRVRAIDSLGNVDATPAKARFRVLRRHRL